MSKSKFINIEENEIQLLKDLENEGLFSCSIIDRVKTAMYYGDSINRKRKQTLITAIFLTFTCILVSASVATAEILWLSTLFGGLALLAFILAILIPVKCYD